MEFYSRKCKWDVNMLNNFFCSYLLLSPLSSMTRWVNICFELRAIKRSSWIECYREAFGATAPVTTFGCSHFYILSGISRVAFNPPRVSHKTYHLQFTHENIASRLINARHWHWNVIWEYEKKIFFWFSRGRRRNQNWPAATTKFRKFFGITQQTFLPKLFAKMNQIPLERKTISRVFRERRLADVMIKLSSWLPDSANLNQTFH